MSIQQLSCFFNLCFSCSSRSSKRRRDCLLPPPAVVYAAAQASPPHHTPIAGLAIPVLTQTSCYSPTTAASHCSQSSKPSYSPLCGKQLSSLPGLWVIPFLGHTIVHRLGALGAAWSTWSRNDFHRKRTVRGEADSWVHGRSKEVPPYYTRRGQHTRVIGEDCMWRA